MALGDFVKKIYVKIKVDGAEEAKAQLEEIKLEADRLKDGVTVKVDVDKAGLSRLDSLFQRIRNMISGFNMPLPGPLPALSGPGGLAAVIAALATLPFLAQAAAGASVFGLGGALTAIGVYAEMGTRSVRYQFAQLVSGKDGISATLKNISPAFGQALTTILSAARTFVPQFIRDFGPALDAISGPLKSLGVMIAGTLASPQIRTSIIEMGKAFGGILKALTPLVPGMFSSIANGFTNVARAIEKNPKPIADLIAGLAHLIGMLLDTIAWLTQVADYIEQHWIPAWRRAQGDILNWTMDVGNAIGGFVHLAAHDIDNLVHWWLTAWDTLWNNTIGRVERGVSEVMSLIGSLPGRIRGAVAGFGSLLYGAGQALLQGLIHGIESMVGSVISQVVGVGQSIISSIGHALGIGSPSRLTFQHGVWLAQGLAMGMDSGSAQVGAAAMRLARSAVPGPYIGAGGGGLQVVLSAGPGADSAVVRAMWPYLRAEVRIKGGGGPHSVQRALGQVYR